MTTTPEIKAVARAISSDSDWDGKQAEEVKTYALSEQSKHDCYAAIERSKVNVLARAAAALIVC